MESKNKLESLLGHLNKHNLEFKAVITYNWWPENKLKLQLNGKTFHEIGEDTPPQKAYEMAYNYLVDNIMIEVSKNVHKNFIIYN